MSHPVYVPPLWLSLPDITLGCLRLIIHKANFKLTQQKLTCYQITSLLQIGHNLDHSIPFETFQEEE